MTVLDGARVAKEARSNVQRAVETLENEHGITPRLDAVLAGEDPASQVYVRKKREDCEEVGIESHLHTFPATVSTSTLLDTVRDLNDDASCDGILVQLPLPEDIDEARVLEGVDPGKDADGFHPVNLGRLLGDEPGLAPATPTGILHLLDAYDVPLRGQEAVIVGRSSIVGKPLAALFLQRGVDATVTVAHSKTRPLEAVTRRADVLVVAAGRRDLVTADMVKEGAVVVDVGINRDEDDQLTGDVVYEDVMEVADAVTPVPGGVGPLTRAMLLVNVLRACCARRGVPVPQALARVVPESLRG